MPIRIDWEEIKSRVGDVTAIYALTHRQSSLILSAIERLEWKATYRDFGYDYADWDLLQQDVADLNHNLTMPVNLVDIVELIDEVEDLLRQLNQHAQCCDGAGGDPSGGDLYTDPVTDGVGDVPQNIIDAGYASSTSDWAGFDDYKCMISHVIVDHMEHSLRAMLPHIDSTGLIFGGIATVAALIGAIIATGGTALVVGIIGAVAAASTVWAGITKLLDVGTEDLADSVQVNHDELVCAVYQSDGVDGALAALNDKIDELFTDTEALVLKNLNLGPNLKALYGGRYNQIDVAEALADKGYQTINFTCDCGEWFADFVFLQESIVNYVYSRTPPACNWNDNHSTSKYGYKKSDDSYWNGPIRMTGDIIITGTIVANSNCSGSSRIMAYARLCAKNDLTGWPTCSTTWVQFYNQLHSGTVNLRIPFDRTESLGTNMKMLVVETSLTCTYGVANLQVGVDVQSIQHV